MKGKKLIVSDMYFSILTSGPLAGRPGYFIDLTGKGKKIKIDKIIKKILKGSTSHLCVVKGMDQKAMPDLVTAIVRAGMYVQIETDGTSFNEGIPWLPVSVFVVITPTTKDVDAQLATKALAFKYIINSETKLAKDGLPTGIYHPSASDNQKIMVEPEWDNDPEQFKKNVKTVTNITLFFGFYLSMPVNKMIGLK